MRLYELAAEEAREAGFEVELIDGVVPLVPMSSLATAERTREFFLWLEQARHVGGARMYVEGAVLEPPRGEPKSLEWPFTEPEVARKYGLLP